MQPHEVIDLVVSLEKNLADFYRRLNGLGRFEKLRPIFRYMHEHSEIHSELIGNFRSDAVIPKLDTAPLTALHDKIETALYRQLAGIEDTASAYAKLAHAEEVIGQMYAGLANHYRLVADTYQRIASKFDALADDERQHGAYIRKQMPGSEEE